MSRTLIGHYLAELDRLRKVSGSSREQVLREAFKDLLKAWGRQHDLVFVPEYELDTATRDPTIRARFDTYRFKDHKERVVDLLGRVTRVSVETMRIVDEIRQHPR